MRTRASWLAALSVAIFGACSRGINAGGESPTDNGGVAFIVMAVFLVLICVVLWLVLGREE